MKFIPASLVEAVKTPSFIEKSVLLIATAGLTGLLVPEVSSRMAEDRSRQGLIDQAEMARQEKVIDAQAAYYDRFADLVWEFQLLCVNVSFRRLLASDTGLRQAGEDEAYVAAAANYSTKSTEILGRLRAEISKGKRLMDDRGYQTLLSLFEKELLQRDAELERLIQKHGAATRQEWQEHHVSLRGPVILAIDTALDTLAAEMNLSAPKRK